MLKKIVAGSVGLLLFVPLVSSAQTTVSVQAQIDALLKQVAQLQAQITALQGQSSIPSGPAGDPAPWVSLTYTLTLGSTDATTNGEVSKLQKFLKSEGVYPEGLVTGYFGPATSRAVQKWQTAHGIAITTVGNAVVGPKTRAAMIAKFTEYNAATQITMRVQLLSLTSKNQTVLPVLKYRVDGNVSGNGYISIVSQSSGATIWFMEQEPSGTHDIDLNTLTAIDGSPVNIVNGYYFLEVQDKFADNTGDALVGCNTPSKCVAVSAAFYVAPGVMGN